MARLQAYLLPSKTILWTGFAEKLFSKLATSASVRRVPGGVFHDEEQTCSSAGPFMESGSWDHATEEQDLMIRTVCGKCTCNRGNERVGQNNAATIFHLLYPRALENLARQSIKAFSSTSNDATQTQRKDACVQSTQVFRLPSTCRSVLDLIQQPIGATNRCLCAG